MHWIIQLTLLALSAINAYLIFRRDWDPMDAWLFVAGAAVRYSSRYSCVCS